MVNDLLVPVTHTLPDGFRPEEEMASYLVNFFVSKMDKILDRRRTFMSPKIKVV